MWEDTSRNPVSNTFMHYSWVIYRDQNKLTILATKQYNRGTMDRDFTVYVNLRTI
jgi:hypothetical protein